MVEVLSGGSGVKKRTNDGRVNPPDDLGEGGRKKFREKTGRTASPFPCAFLRNARAFQSKKFSRK